MHTISDKKLLMLKPTDIRPAPNQPRKSFDEYELKLLANSISASGIIQPLTVRKNSDGEYELIAGERRLRAAKLAGLRRVPCVLHKTDETSAAFYALIENLQRKNLNFFEEAAAIEKLIGNYSISQSEVAVRLGIAKSTLCNKLKLLRMSDNIKAKIIAFGLTERYAYALLRVPEDKRAEALNHIIAHSLTIEQTETFIESLINPQATKIIYEEAPREKSDIPIRKSAIGDERFFSNSLSKLLETLQNAGVNATSRKYENEKYIEYRIRIDKNFFDDKYKQLKIC